MSILPGAPTTIDRFAHIRPFVDAAISASACNFIYLMERQNEPLVKIGRSKNPKTRAVTISGILGSRVTVRHYRDFGLNALQAEHALHRLFLDRRVWGEWFRISLDDARTAVDTLYESIGRRLPDLGSGYDATAVRELVEKVVADIPPDPLTTLQKDALKAASRKIGAVWIGRERTWVVLEQLGFVERLHTAEGTRAVATDKGHQRLLQEAT